MFEDTSMSIFLDVMKEELERNLYKQKAFEEELKSLPKGYLSICIINGKNMFIEKEERGIRLYLNILVFLVTRTH